MKLPKQVRVGFRTYKIEPLEDSAADAASVYGYCDHLRSLIKVNTNNTNQEVVNTVLHEVLHLVYKTGGLHQNDDEERIVTVFSNLLCQVVQDNPELISFIQKASKIGKHGT